MERSASGFKMFLKAEISAVSKAFQFTNSAHHVNNVIIENSCEYLTRKIVIFLKNYLMNYIHLPVFNKYCLFRYKQYLIRFNTGINHEALVTDDRSYKNLRKFLLIK